MDLTRLAARHAVMSTLISNLIDVQQRERWTPERVVSAIDNVIIDSFGDLPGIMLSRQQGQLVLMPMGSTRWRGIVAWAWTRDQIRLVNAGQFEGAQPRRPIPGDRWMTVLSILSSGLGGQ